MHYPVFGYLLHYCVQGIGLTPEAIETNYVVYDLMMEMSWRISQPNIDLDLWVQNFTNRRYGMYALVDFEVCVVYVSPISLIFIGAAQSDAQAAWKMLEDGPYACTKTGYPQSLVALRPTITFPGGCNVCYNTSIIPRVLYLVCLHSLVRKGTHGIR